MFSGLLSITQLRYVNGQLLASGTLTPAGLSSETFTDIPLAMSGKGSACRILELDLGPLHLDLLGLVVDLNEVMLDVTAVRGPGNLLGNLLCALTGLLDGGPLAGITALLAQINQLLGSLLG